MKYIILTFSLLFLSSCWEITVSNQKIEITPWCYLYTIQSDNWWGRNVYTTICDTDKKESTSYTESCWKNCTRNVEVTTVHK